MNETPHSGNNFAVLAGIALATGVVIGALYAGVVYFIETDFIYIFPFVLGAAIAGAMSLALSHKSNIVVLCLIGVLALIPGFIVKEGITTYMSRTDAINSFIDFMAQETGETVSPEDAQTEVDLFLKEETGHDGYIGTYIYDLQSTSVSRKGRDYQEVGIGGGLTVLAIQLIIALVTLCGTLNKANHEPEEYDGEEE